MSLTTHFLTISMNGDFTASLGNQIQCCNTLPEKKAFLKPSPSCNVWRLSPVIFSARAAPSGWPLENTFKSPHGLFRCLRSNHLLACSPIPLLTSTSRAASGSYQQNRELQVFWVTAEIPFWCQLSQGDLDTSCQLIDEWSSLGWSWHKASNRLGSHNRCFDNPSLCCGH